MLGISEFFKKIQGSFAREISTRMIIKDAIKKHTGAEVPLEAISIKAASVVLGGVNQATRSAIYIKKQVIIKEISGTQELRYINDIR